MDIITHLAVCASGDWARIDRIVVGNFVTASQAQRKWYTRVISKVSSGDYRLGAVRVFKNFVGVPVLIVLAEFCKYHRPESYDRPVRRGEDAGLRSAWYPIIV